MSTFFFCLGDTQYIVWSTSSDQGLFALVGGKKIKINKISYLACIGGKFCFIFEHTCAYAWWALMYRFLSVCLSVI